MADKAKNLQWGSANRPKVENKLGVPIPVEGSDGDMQVRQTVLGAKLFGKIGGRWHDTPLGIGGKVKFGTSISNYLSIDNDSVDIFANNIKVASFGATTTVGNLNSSSGGDITVDNIILSGRITLDSTTGSFTLGASNIMIGTNALESPSTTGGVCEQNIAIGHQALQDLEGEALAPCISNVAIGVGVGRELSDGSSNNIIIGTNACGSTTTSNENTIIGVASLSASAASQRNTAVGYNALKFGTGDNNVCLGYRAGNSITSGDNNTCIGDDADADAGTDNQIAIGSGAITDGVNKGRWGNSSVVTNNIQADWTVDSDSRIKKNIENSDIGLSFVNALKTRKYKKKHPSEYDAEILEARYKEGGTNYDNEKNEIIRDEFDDNKVWNGLIAQEVKAVMDELGVEFSGWSEDTSGKQGIQYSTLVMPLIKAVQELSAKVDAMQVEINNLK